MRRAERAITDKGELHAVLEGCEVLRVGLTDSKRAYIVPMHFAFEETDGALRLYLHGATEGRRMEMLRENPLVCFEADRDVQTITASAACGYSAAYESIIGEGEMRVLTSLPARIHALDLLMARHGFEGKPRYQASMLARTAVFEIRVTQISGKRHEKPL